MLDGAGTAIDASGLLVIALSAKVWALRFLIIVGIVFLCWLADSANPALAFVLVGWPNGLFLVAFTKGALHLPRFLEPVHPIEPVVYRWMGVGFVKRIVATRLWPMLFGFDSPPKPKSCREFLDRTELSTKGAEMCHGATFLLAFAVALYCLVIGQMSAAVWILVFNMALNGYPVMLQRSNRRRIHQIRANQYAREENTKGDQTSFC